MTIDIAEHNKRFFEFVLWWSKPLLFVNGKEIHKCKAKDSDIVATPLCLGNISKDWTVENMKITGLNEYFYDFSFDYSDTAVDGIFTDIHIYLMKQNNIV